MRNPRKKLIAALAIGFGLGSAIARTPAWIAAHQSHTTRSVAQQDRAAKPKPINYVTSGPAEHDRYSNIGELKGMSAAAVTLALQQSEAEFYKTLYRKIRFAADTAKCDAAMLAYFDDRYAFYCDNVANSADRPDHDKTLYRCRKEIWSDFRAECGRWPS